MLTIVTRKIHEIASSKDTFYAHCIKVESSKAGAYNYYLAMSFGDGTPIGLLTSNSGEVLRVWKRLVAVEEYLATLQNKLIGFGVYAPPLPVTAFSDLLIEQFQIDQPSDIPMLNNEREVLLAALRERRSDNGRAFNPAES